jgi:hypothetical protein
VDNGVLVNPELELNLTLALIAPLRLTSPYRARRDRHAIRSIGPDCFTAPSLNYGILPVIRIRTGPRSLPE